MFHLIVLKSPPRYLGKQVGLRVLKGDVCEVNLVQILV